MDRAAPEAVQNTDAARLLRAAREQLDRIAVNVNTDSLATNPTVARMSFVLEFLYEAVLELAPKAA
jgi:hypothetical protein